MENIILGSAGWRSEYAGKLNILSGEQINKFLSEISNFGINHIIQHRHMVMQKKKFLSMLIQLW